MTAIPGTATVAVFQPVVTNHPHIYYGRHDTGPSMASINAGNSTGLYVGGNGLNAAFDHDLAAAGQTTASYASLHTNLFTRAAGKTTTETFAAPHDPMAGSTIVPIKVNPSAPAYDYTGVAFTDVFDDAYCPANNPLNRAMVYVAPPDGNQYRAGQEAAFLQHVTETAVHGVQSLTAYNEWARTNNASTIAALRLNLFSSSIYRMATTTLDEVALAIWAGITKGLADPANVLTEVQMPVMSTGAPPDYFDAVKAKLTS